MLWYDADEPEGRAAILIKRIRELQSKNLLDLNEGFAFKLYVHELDEIRSKYSHSWNRPILMFNRHRRFCRKCDIEDVAYRHQD
jgi:hypothetical protein